MEIETTLSSPDRSGADGPSRWRDFDGFKRSGVADSARRDKKCRRSDWGRNFSLERHSR